MSAEQKKRIVGSNAQLCVLFVAGFRYPPTGVKGGQVFAARSLIESAEGSALDWITLDTTQRSHPPPGVIYRGVKAAMRLMNFVWILLTRRVDRVLVFTTSGLGFVEKSVMVIFAAVIGKPVFLAPRSGWIRVNTEKSASMRSLARLTMRCCTSVICQGNQWRDYYQSLTQLPHDRFAVVNNWIETKDYSQLPYPTDDNRTKVVFLGWIETGKGVWDLLDAVTNRAPELDGVCIFVCGGGSQLPLLREAAKNRGVSRHFKFKGWVHGDDKLKIIAASHVFVLPSHHEGTPNSLLECMAAGRACIATNVGSVAEILDDNINGRLVRAGDVDALGDALVRLAGDHEQCRQLGRCAQEFVREHHDIDVIVPKLLQVLTQT